MSTSIARNQRRHQKAATRSTIDMLTRREPVHASCHKQIAAVAQGLAAELFEQLASDNDFFSFCKKMWPDEAHSTELLRRNFVASAWGKMIPSARATMAKMLRDPTLSHLHEDLARAILLDNELIVGRTKKQSIQSVIYGKGQVSDGI